MAVSAVATLNVITNTNSSKLSDVALANVEALAADECGCWNENGCKNFPEIKCWVFIKYNDGTSGEEWVQGRN